MSVLNGRTVRHTHIDNAKTITPDMSETWGVKTLNPCKSFGPLSYFKGPLQSIFVCSLSKTNRWGGRGQVQRRAVPLKNPGKDPLPRKKKSGMGSMEKESGSGGGGQIKDAIRIWGEGVKFKNSKSLNNTVLKPRGRP